MNSLFTEGKQIWPTVSSAASATLRPAGFAALRRLPVGIYRRKFTGTMRRAHWHQFQVLTKRAERVEELSTHLKWEPNIWMGVSVESGKYAYRIDHLRRTAAQVKFLSIEPLIGPVGKLNLRGIDWVIVGGESGPGARPMDEEWVINIRDQCMDAHVAFFFKQWGGVFKKKTGRALEGRTWDEMPELVAP